MLPAASPTPNWGAGLNPSAPLQTYAAFMARPPPTYVHLEVPTGILLQQGFSRVCGTKNHE